MKKRAISIVLAIIMLLTMLPTTALAAGALKMHLVGGNGEVLSSLEGPVYGYWEARFYTSDGTTESETPIPPDSLSLPDFLTLESTGDTGLCCLKATGTGTGSISYTDSNGTYTMPVTISLPDLGLYTSTSFDASSLVENITIDAAHKVFYIALRPDLVTSDGYQMTAVSAEFGPEVTGTNVTEIGDVSLSADGSYAAVTVTDLTAEGHYHFEATVKDPNSDSSDMKWGRSIWINNDMPSLYYCDLTQEESGWTVNYNDAQSDWWCCPGTGRPACFYFGSRSDVEAGNCAPLSMDDLDFPAYMEVDDFDDHECELPNALEVRTTRFANGKESTDIIYTSNNTEYKISAEPQLPEIGFYTQPTASKDTYFGDEVTVSGSGDAFYIVAGHGCTIPRIEAIRYDETGEDATGSFNIDIANDGSYAKISMPASGDLPAGGYYTVLVEQDWGTLYLSFKLIRGDLPQLSTPTELAWHREYQWDAQTAAAYEERMGAMSFKVGELAQNRFAVEIYSAADSYTSPVVSGSWHFGDMDHSAYFSVTDFIYAELPSGTYKFRIRANGDGTVYRDSEWSEMSPAWTYIAPDAQLSAPDAAGFDWSEDDGHYLSTWQHTGEAGTGYYEINWYYKDGDDFRHAGAGCFDINVLDAGEDGIYNAMLPDVLLEEHGNVNVYYCVRAIPADITQYRISEWSDFSEALDVNRITVTVNEKLDDLLNPPSGQTITVEDVQNALENETAELHTAMAADLELSGGPSSGTLEKIQELEKAVADTVNQEIEVKNSAPQQIKDIAEDITMIGATLNLADKNPGTGTTPTVTLELDEPKSGIVIAEQQHNAVQFSMKLNGAIDKDDKEQAGQQLIVPVVIDMPVPEGINPDFLVILHRHEDGTIEQIRPYIYWNETDGRAHARFVVDSFSDFALVEYDFCFATDSVTKALGDGAFTMTAAGNAAGSIVTYSSSDPSIAEVDPETGRVTILTAGTVTITAIASATEVYPEAQASYVLTVTAPGASNQTPTVPSAGQIQVERPQNGKVRLSSDSAVKGSSVFIFVFPDEGYVLESLTVTDQNGSPVQLIDKGNGEFVFTAPGGKVSVKAVFAPVKLPFTDVSEDSYYFDAVRWALENGITDGLTATTFAPDEVCTRAQIVTFLWRAAGCPEPKGMSSFTDVPADTYYAKAVAWAVENGITGGVGDNKFAPDDVCTRAQMAAFLCRLAGGKAASSTSAFTDVSADAYYAEAVQWAAENGITNGTGDGTTFSPDNTCTRGQIVTFLYRWLVK